MIKKVLVAGAGVVGSEIGFQCAAHGLEVVMHDISPQSLATSRESHAEFAKIFRAKGWLTESQVQQVFSRLSYESDIAKATVDVDIVSESVNESLEVKKATYIALSQHCPPKSIFTTNTSTMLASELAKFVDRPSRFLACHVARPVWDGPMLEIMPHEGTDPGLVKQLIDFAGQVGLVPILLNKEQAGYVSNFIIASFITSALDLVQRGVASFEDVDRVWMIGAAAPIGPVGMMDRMGLGTVYNGLMNLVESAGRSELRPAASYLKDNFLDQGKLGVRSGEGFYSYPNPAFLQEGFLK